MSKSGKTVQAGFGPLISSRYPTNRIRVLQIITFTFGNKRLQGVE
jgi:hypothetical protein